MTLSEFFLNDSEAVLDPAYRGYKVSGISCDSRKVSAGDVFVALQGSLQHGAAFINDAVRRGAGVIVAPVGAPAVEGAHLIHVRDPFVFLTRALQRFHSLPSEAIRLIGVTGTNGKTTITYLLESIFVAAGREPGVIGTINYRYAGTAVASKNTTPSIVDTYGLLAVMRDHHISHCIMEVSSHALDQRRVAGMEFQSAIFTNLTSDHLDYHQNQEHYFQAKARLFDGTYAIEQAVINGDDPFGQRLRAIVRAPVCLYGFEEPSDLQAMDVELSLSGSRFRARTAAGDVVIATSLIGRHNVYNILAAIGAAMKAGVPLAQIQQGVAALRCVPGRLERVSCGQDFSVFVDYAHTEDALWQVLSNIRRLCDRRIIVVFGCGGDRDTTKRPKMARAVEQFADCAIVTNDNPRTEDPEAIARQVTEGFREGAHEVILDRRAAIARAFDIARKGDVVLLAGKGHEDYQIFRDQTIHFDDRQVASELLAYRGRGEERGC